MELIRIRRAVTRETQTPLGILKLTDRQLRMDHSSMNHGTGGMNMDHGMNHHGGKKSSGPMMWQWFHTTINETVIFSWWRVTDLPTLLLSCFFVAAAGFSLEWLRTIRARLKACSGAGLLAARHGSLHGGDTVGYSTFAVGGESQTGRGLFNLRARPFHLRDTLLFGVQTVLSYTIMLVFMTFSLQLCTSLVAGTTLGYWLFGRRRRL